MLKYIFLPQDVKSFLSFILILYRCSSKRMLLFQNGNQNIYNQVIKNEPCQNNTNYTSISQKKRLLAKAQSECMLNVPTKQEPTDYNYLQHCSSACKEPSQVKYDL